MPKKQVDLRKIATIVCGDGKKYTFEEFMKQPYIPTGEKARQVVEAFNLSMECSESVIRRKRAKELEQKKQIALDALLKAHEEQEKLNV